jgi:hypothetical protein
MKTFLLIIFVLNGQGLPSFTVTETDGMGECQTVGSLKVKGISDAAHNKIVTFICVEKDIKK